MAENSKIDWCDHTFNAWRGCQKVSPGCKHCYAENRAGRFEEDFSHKRIRLSDSGWRQPLKWNREAEKNGIRPRVFCASLADVFEDWDGPIYDHKGHQLFTINDPEYPECRPAETADLRRDLFWLIDATPHLDWLLLTKWPENVLRMCTGHNGGPLLKCIHCGVVGRMADWDCGGADPGKLFCIGEPEYRHNVWLGTSVENQEWADKRIPELLKCRDLSPVLFLSCEPLLGHIFLVDGNPDYRLEQVDWVIAGGESGPHARPMHPDWARSLRDQCVAAGVPFFMKQMGGTRKPFAEIPDDLMIRQFPASVAVN